MFDHVVVGVTPSHGAETAVRQALEVTRASGGTLHLVMAYRATARQANALPDEFRWSVSSDNPVDELLRAFAVKAQPQHVRVVSHPVTAEPVEALVRVARDEQADLIVVGQSTRRPTRRMAHVPSALADTAPCAILVV
jgi:nucleotide-binding universal stress UspA family protein